jgi:flagellum-specific peptidoglycan hydrolase FlgJ
MASCGTRKQTASYTRKPYHKTTVATRKPVAHPTKPIVKKATEKPLTKPSQQVARQEPRKTDGNASDTQTLEATTKVKVTTEMVLDYIDLYKATAKSNMVQYGIPASIILAQGILESGAGTGPLSTTANNHFGIKCHADWTGPSVKYDDDSEQECFRKYQDPAESYKDHAIFLTGRTRYAFLFQLDKGDYKAWAQGLRSAGYATDPKYPDKLIGLIERYQLNKFDAEVLGNNYVPVAVKATPAIADNSDYYLVTAGDTLYSISKKFNLTVDELKRLNSLQDNSLSIGQNLKVK